MINDIISGLSSGDRESEERSIYLIGYAFEYVRGLDDGAVPDDIQARSLSESDIDDLKASLASYIKTNPTGTLVSSAYNALRKTVDPTLKSFYVTGLADNYKTNSEVAYQIMMALNDIGEDCFHGRTSLSQFDEEENRDDAERYLADRF